MAFESENPTDILRSAFEGRAEVAGGIVQGTEQKVLKFTVQPYEGFSDQFLSINEQIRTVLSRHGFDEYNIEAEVRRSPSEM